MAGERKEPLEVLKNELEFLEKGGYGNPHHAAWRPQFIFQDSPSCLNYGNVEKRRPCGECSLIEFVPAAHRREEIPCRHIPLDESGLTLDSLYRTGTEEEIYAAVSNWLKTTIKRIEQELPAGGASGRESSPRAVTAGNGN